MILFIVIGIAAFIVLYAIAVYNGLIRGKNRVEEAWSDIEAQLKRRYDLIPNLVETVKGYAAHEKTAFENVTKARAMALGAQTVHEKEEADNMVSSALKSIFAIAEAYPQLRAVETFVSLQNELSDTENKIQAARRFYNGNVRDFNIKVETFPRNIVAGMFKFEKKEFFELEGGEEAVKEPVRVNF